MSTQVKHIETDENGNKWVNISGVDLGTGWTFDGVETFAITENGRILDCDGAPLTSGDSQEIAVKNAIEWYENE